MQNRQATTTHHLSSLLSLLPPPGSVLGDSGWSFPFSVGGGLRRRMERHQELFGTEAVVERSNYLELRGTAFRTPKYEPRAVMQLPSTPTAPPVVVPRIILAAPPAPAPVAAAPAPVVMPPAPVAAAPAPAPAPFVAPAPEPEVEPAWHVIDNDTIARTFGPAPYQAPENPVSNTWTVVDSPANLPAVTPEWNVVNLPGVLMSTTTPETAALTELSKTSVRTIIINSAVWAALLTGIGAALETFVIHH